MSDSERIMDVAVVIPMLNAQNSVGEQLEALSRQSYRGAWEVVIADNGSRDRSRDVALGFTDRLRLRIIDASAIRGAGHARNVGVRATNAPRVAFVDADDVVADDWLEHLMAALERHPAVASRFDTARLNPPELQATRVLQQERGLAEHMYAHFLPHVGGSGLAVRREVHEAIGGFDESLLALEDTDYCWRLQLAGHRLHFEPTALVHVRFRAAGAASMLQAFRYGLCDARLYLRYRGRGMAHASIWADLKRIAVLLRKTPWTRDAVRRHRQQRALANLAGIVLGRLTASWRRDRT